MQTESQSIKSQDRVGFVVYRRDTAQFYRHE